MEPHCPNRINHSRIHCTGEHTSTRQNMVESGYNRRSAISRPYPCIIKVSGSISRISYLIVFLAQKWSSSGHFESSSIALYSDSHGTVTEIKRKETGKTGHRDLTRSPIGAILDRWWSGSCPACPGRRRRSRSCRRSRRCCCCCCSETGALKGKMRHF